MKGGGDEGREREERESAHMYLVRNNPKLGNITRSQLGWVIVTNFS